MHELDTIRAPQAPSRRRRWIWLVLLLAISPLAGYGLLHFVAEKRLQVALAEADQLDPGWRLEEIVAQRPPPLGDEENSVLYISIAGKAMPVNWPSWDSPVLAAGPEVDVKAIERRRQVLRVSFDTLPAPAQLHPELIEAVRTELRGAASALAEARKLATMPRGRHPIVYQREYLSVMMPTIQAVREVTYLLWFDALLRIQDRDLDGALEDYQAMLNAGRSIGDEPMLLPQVVRLACRSLALQRLERVLAHGQVSEEQLAAFQHRLEEEDAEPLLLIGLRGERGGMDGVLEAIQRGELEVSYLQQPTHQHPSRRSPLEFAQLHLPGGLKTSRAALLRALTELVEIARLPCERQIPRIKEFEASLASRPSIVRSFWGYREWVGAFWRGHANLRCAAAALAVERYRLRHGRWPESLNALVPAYLKTVPLDPYDGAPLRFRRGKEGVVVYALGLDGQDDGGDFSALNTYRNGTDLGFRLWEVQQRRQPPVPLNTGEEPED